MLFQHQIKAILKVTFKKLIKRKIQSLCYVGPSTWDNLLDYFKSVSGVNDFRHHIKKYFKSTTSINCLKRFIKKYFLNTKPGLSRFT